MIKASIRIVHDRKNETKGNRDIPALLQVEIRQLKTSKRIFISTNYKLSKNQFTYSNGVFNCFNHFQSDIITLNVNIRFITENIIEMISELRNQEGKDIWLVGGGELISMLLAADLIDEMQICYIPIILGKGISLFSEQLRVSKWKLIENKMYKNSVLSVTYKRKS